MKDFGFHFKLLFKMCTKYANNPERAAALTCPPTTSIRARSRRLGASARRTGWWATAASPASPAPLTRSAVRDHYWCEREKKQSLSSASHEKVLMF